VIIVSNTGPLIGLAKIHQLDLLGTLRSLGYWVSDEVVAVVKDLAGE